MTAPPPRKVFMYVCGCVELDAKGSGVIDVDCGDPSCYRRTRRADVVQVGRSARRKMGHGR